MRHAPWLKGLARGLLRRSGFELLHSTGDPVLASLRATHETLRLRLNDALLWDDTLPQLAASAHLRHLLRLHDVDFVIDVGANRGQFARLTRRLGYRGDIVSFEPMSRYADSLRRASERDGRWRIVSVALGNEAATLDLQVYRDDSFSSLHTINSTGSRRFAGLVERELTERVEVQTLDSLWGDLSGGRPRRVLLKTDTQGHDLAVLSGAVETMDTSVRAVVTEASLVAIYDGAPTYAEVQAWIEARGFVLSGLFPIAHRPEDLAVIELDAFFSRRAT